MSALSLSLRTLSYVAILFVVSIGMTHSGFGASISALAQEETTQTDSNDDYVTRRAKTRAKFRERMEKEFEETGKSRQCIGVRQIKSTKVLDDQTIFFRGPGSSGFLNALPRACSNLSREDRFSYRIGSGSALCSGQIITVLDRFGRQWGACSLGEFAELKKIKKKDKVSAKSGD